MSRIAIAKIRSPHDLEWSPSVATRSALRLLGAGAMLDRMERSAGQPFLPQLALPYLAALGDCFNQATGAEHSFTLVDEREENARLAGYDLVMLTVSTTNAPQSYRVADALLAGGVPVVLGGIHPSVLPEEAGRHATAVVAGEAEEVLFELLSDFGRGELKPLYKGGRRSSLHKLPVPRWQDAEVADYCPWVVPVQTSRGCRNACHFCSTTRYQGAARRHRPVEDIVRELETLRESGVLTPDKTVFFTDNNIVSDHDHRRGIRDTAYARRLFEALVPLGVNWVGQGELAVGEDPELVALMAESGCHLLLTGIETTSDEKLDALGKASNDPCSYEEAIRTLHRHGVGIIGCMIVGLDGDTPEVFEQTRRFIDRHVDVPQISVLTPYPGTALYRRMKAEGRVLHQDWSRYDITQAVHRPGGMSVEELGERYDRLCAQVYSYPAMVRRALRYALTRTVNGRPAFGRVDRFTSILAPNLVYRGLTEVGRRQARSCRGAATAPAIAAEPSVA